MENREPFVFRTERRLVLITGKSARNLAELLDGVRQVSGSAIFYHTHHQYLSHHFEKPTFHNDFAIWASAALQEEALAEKFAAIDILAFGTIRQLRDSITGILEDYGSAIGGRLRDCLPGYEFHFCESKSFIHSSGLVAGDVADFFAKLPKATNTSLYFHFFEARLRLERPANDFSAWLRYRGANRLALSIERLNPYRMTMEELKSEIMRLGESEMRTYGKYVG